MKLYTYEKEHLDAMRALAPECAVLLKSNGAFPLSAPGRLALYGPGARHTLKGGTGSGDVNSRFFLTAEQGLKNAGFTITTGDWLDAYDDRREEAHRRFVEDIKRQAKEQHVNALMLGMGAVMPEPAYGIPLNGEGDTAVYVLSRVCGEGNDRRDIPGDFRLTETEIHDILLCNELYPSFMLVLNVGAVVDLSPVLEVGNILVLSQLGAVTGAVLADLLLGNAYPSGKLTDTWAAADRYPAMGTFGDRDDTLYREGVYVGYRYFDSVGADVLFPFGFGLAYTSFETKPGAVRKDGRSLVVEATVTNTGARPGREVVQLYVSAPWGVLDHPYQSLAAFRKTGELAPGASETVTLTVDFTDLASYDAARAVSFLEKGDYVLRVGTSSRDTTPIAVARMEEEIVIRRLTNLCGKPDTPDWKPASPVTETLPDLPVLSCSAADFEGMEFPAPAEPSERALAFAKGLTDEQLLSLAVGAHSSGIAGITSVIGSSGQKVAGAAGETYGGVPGLRALVMADGPAGLRLSKAYTKDAKGVHAVGDTLPAGFAEFLPPIALKLMSSGKQPKGTLHYQYCTAIPIGSALAQSWNPETARICGDIVGAEMERFGVDLWLAPAINLHRSPLCGRNFEYYSEDPLISGLFGAAIARGVQAHPGRSVTVKHYCCNNQETNRYQNNSILSERALRELYLRCFEVCLREGNPHCVMTSYNLVNGVHASEHAGLLTTVLRKEWGWGGLIMTDWVVYMMKSRGKHRFHSSAFAVKAGNNLMMPGSDTDDKSLRSAFRGKSRETSLSRAELERSAGYLIDLVFESTGA